ncbi:MAG: acyltransferase family protein [Cyanobacteria bacterium CRU_2_1]|nr:acyltransferase family protein [Cyanobacteria bacterium CRU_2_1]
MDHATVFTLSGTSIHFALSFRNPRQFIQQRVTRLLIPLIFGILILIPPQVYIERLGDPEQSVAFQGMPPFSGSFVEFYPEYFQGWYAFGGNFAWMGLHLWYLLMLFGFSLLTLPLFGFLNRSTGQMLITQLAALCKTFSILLVLGLPIALLETALDPETLLGTHIFGGWALPTYLIFLICGYLIVADRQFELVIQRNSTSALILAILTTLLLFLTHEQFTAPPAEALFRGLRAFNAWFWVVVILVRTFLWGGGTAPQKCPCPNLTDYGYTT